MNKEKGAQQKLYDQLLTLDACSLLEGIQKKRFSSLEIVEAYLKRIEILNSTYKAIVTQNEEVISQAKEADNALKNGEVKGLLHGIPITIKDAIETKGIRTTVGHKIFENYIPKTDASVVKILKKAGAVIMAKSNCASLCWDAQTSNSIFGITSNPWNTEHTSGGSSGGEAVATALGLTAMGIGSDTAGSIRIPASYCGIYGLKPTNHIIPKQGLIPPLPGKPDLDVHLTTIGPIARSIEDLKLFFHVITGEVMTGPSSPNNIKIGWSNNFPGVALDDEVKMSIITAADKLKNNVLHIEEIPSPFDFKSVAAKGYQLSFFEFIPEEYNPSFYKKLWRKIYRRTLFKGGTFREYRELLTYREHIIEQLDIVLNRFDCWLIPVTPTTAFKHNPQKQPIPVMQNGKVIEVDYLQATTSFTIPFNFTGHPSVVIPIGLDKQGLPIAIQLIGKRGYDMDLLNTASVIDKLIGGIQHLHVKER